MKNGESVQDFVSRILDVVYQVRTLGDTLTEQVVVSKILRSLTPKFIHVVSCIIEVRNLTTLSVDELSGSLNGHEGILNLSRGQVEEKAIQINLKQLHQASVADSEEEEKVAIHSEHDLAVEEEREALIQELLTVTSDRTEWVCSVTYIRNMGI